MHTDLRAFENAQLTLDHVEGCAIPGYLILRPRRAATSLSELPAADAGSLGEALSIIVAAIEQVTGADRVYVLCFAELDRRVHFHLFPRTPWLLDAYRRARGTRDEPINGPRLFEWARTTFVADEMLPAGVQSVADAVRALRERLRQA